MGHLGETKMMKVIIAYANTTSSIDAIDMFILKKYLPLVLTGERSYMSLKAANGIVLTPGRKAGSKPR